MISGGSSLCTRSPSLRGMETNEQRRRQCHELVVAMSLIHIAVYMLFLSLISNLRDFTLPPRTNFLA
ncbi:hypothetical protein ARMGADRAFT_96013 [Armillaria gallica]|uniref:Uncharacterized protein n=1 Tax=Armillaria gallica TaxID=47427 RepID=A0A2H3CNM6_ARMGA|nr:hypothetical protein ARMGADRAFT_96013 [Armillaria gallica]